MRAPTPSFKTELAAFRASRHPPKTPGSRGPDGLGNYNSADMELIDHWLDDERAEMEETWSIIKSKAPNLSPEEFIQAVLTARRRARAAVNRTFGVPGSLAGFNKEWATLKKETFRRLSEAPRIELATILEDAAREVRELQQFYFHFADQVGFRLSRQGSNDDRARIAFYEIMSSFLQEHCGEKRYDVITALAEIAFPGKMLNDAGIVRDALRRRKKRKSARL